MNHNKTKIISLRVREKDFEAIKKSADESGTSISDYIRAATFKLMKWNPFSANHYK